MCETAAPRPSTSAPPAPEPRDPQAATTVVDLLFTLEVCERALPADAHPVHRDRLRRIRQIVEAALR
jgi:hypothetical protein